jgi:hypothetical protein
VVLSLAVFEPLLCIVHCQLWIPFVLHNYFAADHHHHMHNQAAAALAVPVAASEVPAALDQNAVPAGGCAIHAGHPSGSPLSPLPSPLHEMLLTLVLPILIVLLAVAYPSAPLTDPTRVFIPVPLRPPIPIAG